ncbi:PHB depolymerase family esterase [Fulvimarina sp. 2208YS6-2-32]|uniref:PHB depolymerase family esterase n=1 Tax=Fulvimarina uroteuthidis TaxID=3098149 RepID=A0ABU5HX56_9HYPH|nr:PHB depolymerase family esterase [Fulvimarina sp. 2208YS6-2-32]MDY8107719.1 PHB depolymerase family esterase [Fulvimarina sp. 2208YS6-2-32]
MKSSMNIDMMEVTRLTQAGRLEEAMRLLQGGRAEPAPARQPEARSERETVELRRVGDEWSMPGRAPKQAPRQPSGREAPGAGKASGTAHPSELADRIKTNLFSAPFADKLRQSVPAGFRKREAVAVPVAAGASFLEKDFQSAVGARPYKLYVPSTYKAGDDARPLIVMLHGCTQSPDDFAIGTKMNELAEERNCLVLYPGQTKAANASMCWNWFSAKDQQRHGGEPEIIADMVRGVMGDYNVDPRRVFAAGLSAGGAAAAILGQRYPDLFAAIGVHSGLACGAARDMPSAFAAMQGRGGASSGDTSIPAIVFHGTGDTTVAPDNARSVGEQARGGASTRETVVTGRSDGGVSFTRTIHHAASGSTRPDAPRQETWLLAGMGHAWSGGDPKGSYTDPSGPDASREMLRFFDEVAGAGA